MIMNNVLKTMRHAYEYVKYLGVIGGIKTYYKIYYGSGNICLSIDGYKHSIELRRKSIDSVIFEHIILKKNTYQSCR